MTPEERKQRAAELWTLLSKYEGGEFSTGGREAGGGAGMVFWRDRQGRAWFMGGFHPCSRDDEMSDSERIVGALNLAMELLYRG